MCPFMKDMSLLTQRLNDVVKNETCMLSFHTLSYCTIMEKYTYMRAMNQVYIRAWLRDLRTGHFGKVKAVPYPSPFPPSSFPFSQPCTQASSCSLSYQRRLGTKCDSIRPWWIFPASLTGDVSHPKLSRTTGNEAAFSLEKLDTLAKHVVRVAPHADVLVARHAILPNGSL